MVRGTCPILLTTQDKATSTALHYTAPARPLEDVLRSWNLPHTPHYARTKLPALRYIILPLLVRLRKFYDVDCLAVCKRLLVPLG